MLEISETFSFEDTKLYAEKLETKYPFLSCTIIGRSHCGRGIFSYSLGRSSDSVLIVGATGGKSAETALVLYRFIDRVCESVSTGSEISGISFSGLIKKYGITIIPCLNPDSAQLYAGLEKIPFGEEKDRGKWDANAFGVDINLNFDSDWRKEKMLSLEKNILFACAGGFPGNMKESEPETRAFTALCRRRNFRSCLTLQSSEGGLYYRRGDKSPVSSSLMAKILASSCGCGVSESEMPPCPSRWFIDEFSKPAFLLGVPGEDNENHLSAGLEETLVLMSVM